jgi:hypothetical protein
MGQSCGTQLLHQITNNLNGLYASQTDLAAMLKDGLKDDPKTAVEVLNKLAARIVKDDT